ncbi:MAG: hypothetical protein J5J00_05880 [Deltaproteobacteria bacterium]|nr:hypothetical protein [Deltaproteobacteria bacterium]
MHALADKVKLAERAVLAAGAHLNSHCSSGNQVTVSFKDDSSMVMNLDIECQRIIKDILGNALPVAAEEDEESHAFIDSSGDYFTVDPIDGTSSCKRYLGSVSGGQLGFGPLVGVVCKGKLCGAAYYNVPTATLYTAQRGEGAKAVKITDAAKDIDRELPKRSLRIDNPPSLTESALIFFPGSIEELKAVLYLRNTNSIENSYRFGGFANDCIRLAEGWEQVQLQTRVKAWDFAAVLIPIEAGLYAEADPFGRQVPFDSWTVARSNPVLIAARPVFDELKRLVRESLSSI